MGVKIGQREGGKGRTERICLHPTAYLRHVIFFLPKPEARAAGKGIRGGGVVKGT